MQMLQTFVAKGLLLAKQRRPDIMLGIAYLSAKIRSLSENDWDELTDFLQFLTITKEDILRLSMEDNCAVKWYLVASFVVHEDMKSHTGVVMTLGEGLVQEISMKQRTNTRGSIEADFISFDDKVSKALWKRLFPINKVTPSPRNHILRYSRSN
jgi:hypothetical protein